LKRIFIYLFVLVAAIGLPGHALLAQPKKVPADSSRIQVRTLPGGTLKKYRGDEEFNYKQEQAHGAGLWTRFWIWVFQKLNWGDSSGGGGVVSSIFRLLVWGICIFVLIYAVLKFAGMSGIGLFMRNPKKEGLDYAVTEDDIYAIDFPDSISEAVNQKNYRLAIRLLYLQTLRRMADQELIRWKPNKTNDVYATELAGSNYYSGFTWLTRVYDYAWYGDFPVQEQQFTDAQQHFQTFQQQLPA